ncbi:MAG: glycosyltransferase [Bacteroidia bacterium]|nr:glycosyltransferase [Bacteroidia bacterium]
MTAAQWGGSEELWSAAAAYALSKGDEIIISVYDQMSNAPQIVELVNKGAHLHTRALFKNPELIPPLIKRAFNFIKRKLIPPKPPAFSLQPILDFQPDVLCINQGDTYAAALDPEVIKLVAYNIPYVLISQFNREISVFQDIQRIEQVKKFCLGANYFLFVSERNFQIAKRQLFNSMRNSRLIGNAPSLKHYDLITYPSPNECYQMACVARLEANIKGQDLLLEVLAQPHWKNRNWQLNLYGSGPSYQYLKCLAENLGIAHRVYFHGHVKDIKKIWQTNHINILPSISEGTPLSLQEAMICGRPSVVTDVGDNAKLVGYDQERGFIAEAPTLRYLSNAMEKAWESRNHWEQMGIAAHQYIKEHINMYPEIELYDYLCKSKK